LERQVRIEGIIERLTETESYAYFATRPKGSRIGAWASPQSQPLPNRQALEQLFEQTAKRYETTDDIPLPPHWGGFRLIPRYFEFWQGRHSRLHDRIVYEKTSDGWNIGRIAP